MNIKTIIITLLLLSLNFSGADAVSYKKADKILLKAISLYRKLPSSPVKWEVLGKSNWKKRIYYKEFGSGKKLTIIVGGMHGDEPAGFIASVKLAKYITGNPSSLKNRVIIIPCLNPDGLMKGRRTNAHDVDLNRNFPTESWSSAYVKPYNNPGLLPASEPETVLLANAIDKYRPDVIIQMHQPFNAIYPDDRTTDELMQKMSEISGFPVAYDIGYATPGSLGTFKAALEYKVTGITYELGRIDREPDYDKVSESLLAAINY